MNDRIITDGLPPGWQIVQSHMNIETGEFRLLKDGVWIASGQEWPRDRSLGKWKIHTVADPSVLAVAEKVIGDYRDREERIAEAIRRKYWEKCEADQKARAAAAITAVFGRTVG